MTRTIALDGAPTLTSVFAKAVATGRARKGGELPDLQVIQENVAVDVAALAAYDNVCGFTVSDVLPATYLHVLVFPLQASLMADRAFPFPLMGSVHLRNVITQHRPVRSGEVLQLRTTCDNLRPHRRGAQADLVGEVRVGDELVWEGRSTYLFRGQQVPGAAQQQHEADHEQEAIDGPGAIWRLPKDLGRRYAAVSGDANPIHLHPLGAKALGFPTTIAHGMWSKARMLAAVQSKLPERFTIDVSFRKPVFIPSTVRFVAHAVTASAPAERPTWQLALRNNSKGTVHAVGSIS